MITLTVQTTTPYDIHIGEEILKGYELPGKHVVVITDKQVEDIYADKISNDLTSQDCKYAIYSFPQGEMNKTRKTKEFLEDKLLQNGWGKETIVIGFGGGVVTDVAGFLASTYYRGVRYIAVPTTLIGMVDASIGGKNGVNTPLGKNLIGTIYQPHAVLCDLNYLKTLPETAIRHGWVEMLKHGLIADAEYYHCLKGPIPLPEAIKQSCIIKKGHVEQDADEKRGLRKALNFGHTVGHAIEAISDYAIPHGEAVAFGIAAESYLSWKLGLLPPEELEDILTTMRPYFSALPSEFVPEKVLEAARRDKKTEEHKIHCSLISRIGQYKGCIPIEDNDLIQALKWLEDAVRSYQRA